MWGHDLTWDQLPVLTETVQENQADRQKSSNSHFGKIALWERFPSRPAYGRDGKMPLTQEIENGSAS
jgi:hypothetical protein